MRPKFRASVTCILN